MEPIEITEQMDELTLWNSRAGRGLASLEQQNAEQKSSNDEEEPVTQDQSTSQGSMGDASASVHGGTGGQGEPLRPGPDMSPPTQWLPDISGKLGSSSKGKDPSPMLFMEWCGQCGSPLYCESCDRDGVGVYACNGKGKGKRKRSMDMK